VENTHPFPAVPVLLLCY
jgi:hypothetical protein